VAAGCAAAWDAVSVVLVLALALVPAPALALLLPLVQVPWRMARTRVLVPTTGAT
jgi:hypothetical protein